MDFVRGHPSLPCLKKKSAWTLESFVAGSPSARALCGLLQQRVDDGNYNLVPLS